LHPRWWRRRRRDGDGGIAAVTHLFAGIPTAHYDTAVAWYERFIGRPPDRLPTEQEAVWQLADTGLIYVVGDAARAGNALMTLIVDDIDAFVAGLRERGIEAPSIDDSSAVRRTTITDPDGNSIQIGQVA
jgi:hypothetical protein